MKNYVVNFIAPIAVLCSTGCFDGYVSNSSLIETICTVPRCTEYSCSDVVDRECVRRKEASYKYCGDYNSVATIKKVCTTRNGYSSQPTECYSVTECTQSFDKFVATSTINAEKAYEELNKPRTLGDALRNVNADEVAYSYRMSVNAVKSVLDAMAGAADGDNSKLLGLGLSNADLNQLAKYNVAGVKNTSYEAIAKNVDASLVQVKGLISKFALVMSRLEKTQGN